MAKQSKKILVIHGWNAVAGEHWFPEAKELFGKEGFETVVPEMPGGYFPNKEEWIKIIENFKPDENWILIGHSLGGVAILRYLEAAKKPISQAILIATPYGAMQFKPIENFFENGLDWKTIKANCEKFDIVNESNDSIIPLEHGQKYAKRLKGELHILTGYSHFHSIDLEFLKGLIKNERS